MAKTDQYVTVAPVTPKGKWLVCARRVGSKDRLAPIAETRSETVADKIVDALNHLQGEELKLQLPAFAALDETKRALSDERDRTRKLQTDVSGLNQRLRDEQRDHDNARQKLRASEMERDRIRGDFARYRDENPPAKLIQSAAE